jgi:hypothetical protein
MREVGVKCLIGRDEITKSSSNRGTIKQINGVEMVEFCWYGVDQAFSNIPLGVEAIEDSTAWGILAMARKQRIQDRCTSEDEGRHEGTEGSTIGHNMVINKTRATIHHIRKVKDGAKESLIDPIPQTGSVQTQMQVQVVHTQLHTQ